MCEDDRTRGGEEQLRQLVVALLGREEVGYAIDSGRGIMDGNGRD